MNEKNMRELLERRPFIPVVLTLSSGQQIKISHPENVLLTKSMFVVTFPERDLVSWASLLHITSVENQQAA